MPILQLLEMKYQTIQLIEESNDSFQQAEAEQLLIKINQQLQVLQQGGIN